MTPSVRPFARPRVKFEHQPMRRTDGTIQIGGDIYGIASVIEDPDGWIWAVIKLLDGTRSPDQVVADSGRAPEEVLGVVDALHQSGFLEDAATEDKTTLTVAERDRYSRNQRFYRWIDLTPRPGVWTPQERIKASSVVIVGLGGAGASTALALAASGVGRIHCVDFDTVELSNLTRQFLYTEQDIGRPKVAAAVRRLRAINSTVEVTGRQSRIDAPDDLRELASQHDVVALCADQPDEIQHWAATVCAETGTPWVTGGYVGPAAQVHTFTPGAGPCFECLHLRIGELSASAPSPVLDPHLPGNNTVAAATAASAGVVGMLIAHAVLAHLTGAPNFGANFVYGINLVAPDESVFLAPQPHPDCPLCGGKPAGLAAQVAAH